MLLLIWTILQTTSRLLPLTTHRMDIFDINTHCMDIFRPGPGRGQSRIVAYSEGCIQLDICIF